MIKIRYIDLPEGLHVDVRSEGHETIIYLAPTLTCAQRRAALAKARQAARVGRSVPLPLIPLAFAIGTDRVKITTRSAAAAARVHPVAFAIPAAILITAVVLYTLVASGTMHLYRPPQVLGPRVGNATIPAGPPPLRGSRLPLIGANIGTGMDGTAGSGIGRGGRQPRHVPRSRAPIRGSSSPGPNGSSSSRVGMTAVPSHAAATTPPGGSSGDGGTSGDGSAICVQAGHSGLRLICGPAAGIWRLNWASKLGPPARLGPPASRWSGGRFRWRAVPPEDSGLEQRRRAAASNSGGDGIRFPSNDIPPIAGVPEEASSRAGVRPSQVASQRGAFPVRDGGFRGRPPGPALP